MEMKDYIIIMKIMFKAVEATVAIISLLRGG